MHPLSPEEVQKYFDRLRIPGRFTAAETGRLSASKAQIQSSFLTFPIPQDNAFLSVLGLRDALGVGPANAPAFHDHPWYLDEPFGNVGCAPGWHSVRIEVTAASIGQPIYYAEEMKQTALYLPTAAEVLLMLFLHFASTGERKLTNKHTWTRDRTREGRFVTVGAFGKKGVFVSSHEVGYQSQGLGICPVVDPLA